MTLQKLILFVLAFALTAAPAAHAKVQLYSSFATTGPAPTECTEASAIVTPLIAQLHGPPPTGPGSSPVTRPPGTG
jgi:hypothetical protein